MATKTLTTCTFPALPATVKEYKTQRAAKMGLNRAKAAYETAVQNRCMDEYREADSDSGIFELVTFNITSTWNNLVATANTVREQGFNAGSF